MLSACLLVLAVIAALQPPVVAPPHVAAVWDDDQLLVSDTYTQPHQPHYLSALVRGWVDADPRRMTWRGSELRVPYFHPTSSARGGISKIVSRGDRLWVVGPGGEAFHAIPLDDLQFLELSDWGIRRRVKKFGRQPVGVYGPYSYSVSHLFETLDWAELKRIRQWLEQPGVAKAFGLSRPEPYRYFDMLERTAAYDLVPTGSDTATLVRASGGWLTFADVRLGPPIDRRYSFGRVEVGRTRRVVAVPFEGDFWAYEVGGVYYLLTRAGALYAVRRDGAGWLGAAVKVWDEKDRPLVGAVQDVRGGTVYVFGPDDDPKRGGRFTFELALKPDPAFYVTAAKPGDALREAQDCVTAVRKHLKHPEVPPPPRPVKP